MNFNTTTYIIFIYTAIVFFITNHFSQKLVDKYKNRKIMQRKFIMPIGAVIVTLLLSLFAYIIPSQYVFFLMSPIVCFYAGLVAHLSFAKLIKYQEIAEKHNQLMNKKTKKKKK